MELHLKRDSFHSSGSDKKRTLEVHTGCGENIRQYLLSTSLHGLKYVGSIYITYFERQATEIKLNEIFLSNTKLCIKIYFQGIFFVICVISFADVVVFHIECI